MSEPKKRKQRFQVEINDQEYEDLKKEINQTYARSQAEFVRSKVLGKPLLYKCRSASLDDMTEQLCQLKELLKTVLHRFDVLIRNLGAGAQSQQQRQLLITLVIEKGMLTRQIGEIAEFMRKVVESHGSITEQQQRSEKSRSL